MKVLCTWYTSDGRLLVAAYTKHRKLTRAYVEKCGKVSPVLVTCPTDANFARRLASVLGKNIDRAHVENAVSALDM